MFQLCAINAFSTFTSLSNTPSTLLKQHYYTFRQEGNSTIFLLKYRFELHRPFSFLHCPMVQILNCIFKFFKQAHLWKKKKPGFHGLSWQENFLHTKFIDRKLYLRKLSLSSNGILNKKKQNCFQCPTVNILNKKKRLSGTLGIWTEGVGNGHGWRLCAG